MIVDVADPSAMTELVPVIVELAATADPDWKTTVPPVKAIGESILRVFVSAVVEAREQVDSPVVAVAEQAP